MKLGTFATAAGLAVGLAVLSTPGNAQGPLWDVVHVNMPYTVTIGEKTLQPGNYTIQQNRDSAGGSRILLIYADSDQGAKFETSAMTIPTLDPDTARDTKIVLHHYGSDYYFDKIWVQGKDYGYEFPLPRSVKDRETEKMASVTVPAQYSTTPAQATTTTETSTPNTAATTSEQQTAAVSSTPPDAPVTPPVTTPETTPSTATNDTALTSMPPTTPSNSADRAMPDDTPAPAPTSMPATSAGWLMMLLGGGSLSGLGMAIRRRR